MKKNTLKGIVAATLAGVITVCSIPAIAQGIEALMNSVNIKLDGVKVASVDESYVLQNGTSVPYSILYEGTTYMPIRKVSELLDINIGWDNDTRTVLVETGKTAGYDSWYGAPDFGEFYDIKELAQSPKIRSTTHWYRVEEVGEVTEYTEYLEELGYEKVTESDVRSKFKVYKKGNIEVWMDLGMYTQLVYGVTVVDTTRPIVGRDYTYDGLQEDIPNFGSAFGYDPLIIGGIDYYTEDWHLWACLPDYFALLEQEGFKITSSNNSYYGKIVTLKKDRTSIVVRFNGTELSNLPAISIQY